MTGDPSSAIPTIWRSSADEGCAPISRGSQQRHRDPAGCCRHDDPGGRLARRLGRRSQRSGPGARPRGSWLTCDRCSSKGVRRSMSTPSRRTADATHPCPRLSNRRARSGRWAPERVGRHRSHRDGCLPGLLRGHPGSCGLDNARLRSRTDRRSRRDVRRGNAVAPRRRRVRRDHRGSGRRGREGSVDHIGFPVIAALQGSAPWR